VRIVAFNLSWLLNGRDAAGYFPKAP